MRRLARIPLFVFVLLGGVIGSASGVTGTVRAAAATRDTAGYAFEHHQVSKRRRPRPKRTHATAPPSNLFSPVVTSDLRPSSYSVSWATRTPDRARVEVRIGRRWHAVSDVRGNVRSRTHLFAVPCNMRRGTCKDVLHPHTSYAIRVTGARSRPMTLHVRTTPPLSPFVPIATLSGRVETASKRPVVGALIYATVRGRGQRSVPLATLSAARGEWSITLGNAVTHQGESFPLKAGDRVSIRASTGVRRASRSIVLHTVNHPDTLKRPIILR